MTLLSHHAPQDLVAFGRAGARTAADLLRDAAAVAAALPEAPPGGKALMVFKSDRYAFAAGLLGAWSRGMAVALPPNLRAETITGLLSNPGVVTLLHDTAVAGYVSVAQLLGRAESPPGGPLPSAPRPAGVVAHVHTSGSTGESQVWCKTYGQLVGEVMAWAQTFGLGSGTTYVATVPPAHLYGLLFAVLLPLCTGGAVCRDTPLLPEEVAASVERSRADVLITVPVHLRVAQVIEPRSFASLSHVFSSTAPLSESVAEAFAARHGVRVTEIFGSTETGGIASRRRGASPRWQPLRGVDVSVTRGNQLVVASPFLSEGLPAPFVTADRVEMHTDSSFLSLGRKDSVVKVGGFRVSLQAMEEWLLRQPEVADAVVVATEETVRGCRLLAALVPAGGRGERHPRDEALEGLLRTRMARHFEPSTLPRRMIFAHSLPREPSGKLQRHRVLRLFGLGPQGAALSSELQVSERACPPADGVGTALEAEGLLLEHEVAVPENYAHYGGHFDAYPVMAGVVQLHELLLPLVRQHRPAWGSLRALSRVKFMGRIAPGDRVAVRLAFSQGEAECEFWVRLDDRSVSAGRMSFFEPSEPRA